MKVKTLVWIIVAVFAVLIGNYFYKSATQKPGSAVGKIISNPGYIFDHAAHHGGSGGY